MPIPYFLSLVTCLGDGALKWDITQTSDEDSKRKEKEGPDLSSRPTVPLTVVITIPVVLESGNPSGDSL